jgi:adenine-specific DNA-methyltransferase
MLSEINCKINKLSISLGLGKCLQRELFTQQSLSKIDLDNDTDCIVFCGDNLNHLIGLSEEHSDSIGFCYIDPPYNCGSKFIYNDTRKGSDVGLWGKHSEWMEFMLPRLVAAHALLKKSGVIAISIDDYEFPYLKILMDKIFGEENFLGNIVVCRSKNGKGSKKNIASSHEYLVVYGKTNTSTLRGAPDDAENYDKVDEHGQYRVDGLFRKKGQASLRSDRPNMFYPLYFDENGSVFIDPAPGLKEVFPVDSKEIDRRWLWGKDTARVRAWQLYASPKGTVYVKNYSSEEKRKKIRTLWNKSSYYTERGTLEVKMIYGDKVFDTPKPLEYIKDIIDQMAQPDDLILDFFAGSGTTAHAAYELNKIDGGTRKVIMMESDDLVPEEHLAFKLNYKKICEITETRLRFLREQDDSYKYTVLNSSDTHGNDNRIEQLLKKLC